jgi:hypothetical protein
MIVCSIITENASVVFANAERHVRGAVDILTFPVPSAKDRIDAMGRLKASFMVIVEGLNLISALQAREDVVGAESMARITKHTFEMSESAERARKSTKDLLKYIHTVYGQWTKLLKRKGDFHHEEHPVDAGLSTTYMPESVTLYEDVLQVQALFPGTLIVHQVDRYNNRYNI